MKINTALILCAGYGKRLSPITLKIPKPLIEINEITLLENTINFLEKLEIKNIKINTFYLHDQIQNFILNFKSNSNIEIFNDGNEILDTGGGILNMILKSDDNDFIIFNPDTLWNESYINEIIDMQKIYFSNKLSNILLLVNKDKSFDKNLYGDFNFNNRLLKKDKSNDFIYIGCQILNRGLFSKYKIHKFSIKEIWNELLKIDQLNGFESSKNFYHLTNLETFKKLKDL